MGTGNQLRYDTEQGRELHSSRVRVLISCRKAEIRCNPPLKSKGNQKTREKMAVKPGCTAACQCKGHTAPSTVRGLPALHADEDTERDRQLLSQAQAGSGLHGVC